MPVTEEQRGYSRPKATSLSGTMSASLSLLVRLPPADGLTVRAASGRPAIYASVQMADMQTPVPRRRKHVGPPDPDVMNV